MFKSVVIIILALMCIWFYWGNDLKTYDGCVSALKSQFTGVEDLNERHQIARKMCDELVTEGKVLPESSQ